MTLRRPLSILYARRAAWWSFVFLGLLTLFSLSAELWSNDQPLALNRAGRWYFPVLKTYSSGELGLRDDLEPDYRQIAREPGVRAWWAPNRWGPFAVNKDVAELPSPPSAENWLGTDDRGRDVLARLLYGFRYSLAFALLVWFGSSVLALIYGGLCGFFGGWVDLLGQRLSEILTTVPQLMLLLFAVSVFPPSLTMLILVSCAFGWIGLSFFVRGEVLRVRALPFVESAVALGASRRHVFVRYVLPNCLLSLVTLAPMVITGNLTALAGLDYLGLGLPPPTPSWGELMAQAQNYFTWAMWLAFYPAFLLFLTLLSLTFFADGLRLVLDPFAPRLARAQRATKPKRTKTVLNFGVSRMSALIFILCALTLPTWAAADTATFAADEVGLTSFNSKATGNAAFTANRLELRHRLRRNWLESFGISADFLRGVDDNVKMRGQRVLGQVELNAGANKKVSLSLGVNRLDDFDFRDGHAQDDAQTTIYGAEFGDTSPERWEYSLSTSHDFVYQDWISPMAGAEGLEGTRYGARGEVKLWRRLHLRGAGQSVFLLDQNRSRETDQGFLVETWRGPVSAMLGAGIWYLTYDRAADAYWSPRQFLKYELRSETRVEMDRHWSGSFNANLGRGSEIHRELDVSAFVETHLNYHFGPRTDLNLGWAHLKSWSGGGTWERNDLNVSLTKAL